MLFYTNAADVLPPALLEEIRKHWIGLLYVAPPQDDTENRNQFILNELRSGRQPRDLAAALGISLRRVYQIQKKNRESRCTRKPSVTSSVTFIGMTEESAVHSDRLSSLIEA